MSGSVIVQKYGGSSVADLDRIRRVAERVAETVGAGHRVVVVVSAMGDTTDELLALARRLSEAPPRRELDMLLTAGERIAMALLSMALCELGVEAISFTGSQSGIMTNDTHAGARIVEVRPFRIQDELARGRVVIVAGYQGVSYKREVTTLGRGGSDTTAVALAAALSAEYCEICSDVDAVRTADPRIVDDPERLAEIDPEEMQVLAECGARVLHATAVEYARRSGITLWARATASDPKASGDGTLVRVGGAEAARPVSGVASREVVLVRARPAGDGPGRLEALASALAAAKAPALWIGWAGGEADVVAVLATDDMHQDPNEVASAAGADAAETGLCAVSCVGAGLDTDPTILARVLEAVRGAGASVHHLERSSLRLTVVVETELEGEVVRRVHAAVVGPALANGAAAG